MIVFVALTITAAACGADDEPDGPLTDPAAAADRALNEQALLPVDNGPGDNAEDEDEPDGDTGDPVPLAGELTLEELLALDDPIDPNELPGTVVNQYALTIDQCFDRIEDRVSGRVRIVTTLLPCSEPHQAQIFGTREYPAPEASLYPGDDIMEDYALQACYLLFEAWVGSPYETSELDIGVLTPDRAIFEDEFAPYRGIHCWVHRVDREPMIGSARGSAF